jgi:hypothetical protein
MDFCIARALSDCRSVTACLAVVIVANNAKHPPSALPFHTLQAQLLACFGLFHDSTCSLSISQIVFPLALESIVA